ncbi:MAG: hypothetical protein ABL876_16240, partial [Chitinophagaceae bacterium]
HITSRGNARKLIYKEDEDRRIFLEALHRANTRYNWLCHAYCLMNNPCLTKDWILGQFGSESILGQDEFIKT